MGSGPSRGVGVVARRLTEALRVTAVRRDVGPGRRDILVHRAVDALGPVVDVLHRARPGRGQPHGTGVPFLLM